MSARQCEACQGSGTEIVGENRVTADMASDAGEPSMAGMFHSYEYAACSECGGSGVLEESDDALARALKETE